jgi:hypothetical protein
MIGEDSSMVGTNPLHANPGNRDLADEQVAAVAQDGMVRR